jgi:hypothetical protein
MINRRRRTSHLDGADDVIQISIEGLDEEAACQALKNAKIEAICRLKKLIRLRRLGPEITIRELNGKGDVYMEISQRSARFPVLESSKAIDVSEAPEPLVYLVAENREGRVVRVRIELAPQTIQ